MVDEIKPPTRMSKQELIDTLLTSGYSPEQLLDNDGNKLKGPDVVEKFNAHKQGGAGLEVLSTV